MTWGPGIITATCEDGCYKLPGWVQDPLGLDWGLIDGRAEIAWVIHHMPTGYSIMAVDGICADALRLADLLLSLGDWDFTDPDVVREKFADAVLVARRSGFDVFSPMRVLRPSYPDRLEAALV